MYKVPFEEFSSCGDCGCILECVAIDGQSIVSSVARLIWVLPLTFRGASAKKNR